MIESGHFRDPDLNIPVFSLYSETRIPTADMFAPIDTLVIDIQDVGPVYIPSYIPSRTALKWQQSSTDPW